MQKNADNRKYLVLLCSLSLSVVVTVAGRGMDEPKETLSVNDPRPVALAAEILEKKYGWIITYEDPQFAYEGDLVDVTETVWKNYVPGQARRVLVPKGGELAFEYDIDAVTKRPANAAVVVQQLLDAYAIAGNPGVFRLEQNGQRVHIIAVASKAKNGVLTPYQPVLDTLITVPPQKRTGAEFLTAFCDAISKVSGTSVVLGSVPLNRLYRFETKSGAQDQKARDFLSNELDRMSTNVKWSWKLLFDPVSKTYYLNIHAVKV